MRASRRTGIASAYLPALAAGAVLAACALAAPQGQGAPAAAEPEPIPTGASVRIAGVAPAPTPGPVQTRNTGSTGPLPTVLPSESLPLRPDIEPLSPPPRPSLIPAAAGAATANAATATAGAAQLSATATALPAHEIRIEAFTFVPPVLTVPAGTTVFWRNLDPSAHQVAGPDFDSGRIQRGQYYAIKLEKPGSYTYLCSFHPTMRGQIIVEPPDVPQRFSS